MNFFPFLITQDFDFVHPVYLVCFHFGRLSLPMRKLKSILYTSITNWFTSAHVWYNLWLNFPQVFKNCSCFSSNIRVARLGRCSHNCSLFPYFILSSFFMMCFTFMNNVPILHAVFRWVFFFMNFLQSLLRCVLLCWPWTNIWFYP